jgi:hypothetical protein
MNKPKKKFISDMQKFTAISAIGASALRGQKSGTISKVRNYLGIMNLSKLCRLQSEQRYKAWLDLHAQRLVNNHRVRWGAARKALNLFLRDCLYNKYLSTQFDLEHVERWMEIPLDSIIAKELKKNAGRGMLPPWPGLKKLKQADSERFQRHATEMASEVKMDRVHLDVSLWINNR